MTDFVNTIDLLGDDVVAAEFVSRTITEFNDDELAKVGNYAFCNCKELVSASLPNVSFVGEQAFNSCSKLNTISLPSVKDIRQYAFAFTSRLESVTLPATPPTIQTTSFYDTKSACVFHIPAGSLSAYQSATNWSSLTGQYTFTEDA